MLRLPYKFVSHEIGPLSALDNAPVAILHRKVNAGEALSREEKNRLFSMLSDQMGTGSTGIKSMGYLFSFSGYLKRFWVETKYNGILNLYAPDKTSIRNQYTGEMSPVKIVEID